MASLEVNAVGVDLDNVTLAAAIEYFSADEPPTADTIRKAAQVVQNGDYLFFEDVNTYDELGEAFFYDECFGTTMVIRLPDWLDNYIDFESLGEDVAERERGKFTGYGFFAPERSF